MVDAVFNLQRTPLVVEALRTGDYELLSQVMDDRLHQASRLKRIPGGRTAWLAAQNAGAAAVAVSGSGRASSPSSAWPPTPRASRA